MEPATANVPFFKNVLREAIIIVSFLWLKIYFEKDHLSIGKSINICIVCYLIEDNKIYNFWLFYQYILLN